MRIRDSSRSDSQAHKQPRHGRGCHSPFRDFIQRRRSPAVAFDRRADGVILEALIADQPANDLIPKLVRGLLAHRKEGRWENTQENSFVLLALDKYFNVYEKTTPNFVARAWLGEGYAGDHKFSGRTTERFNVNIPMRYLARHQPRRRI